MRYSLLSRLACPVCHDALVCYTTEETGAPMPAGLFPDATRVSPGRGVGPLPEWRAATPLTALLDRLGAAPASPARGLEVEVESGLLICGGCDRWFPIERCIPELLPDHLRDAARETVLLSRAMVGAPDDLRLALERFRPSGDAAADPGAHYKKAEIGIKARITDPIFFGPGYSSPFNPWNSDFTSYLIALYGDVLRLLELQRGSVVIDSGCGYAWTTDWLFRSGYDAIGVDICRTYLDIAVTRIGAFRPHLVIGDVENLPFAEGIAKAVLAYESFHHIPDRGRALAGYYRSLGATGTVILAEPGATHEGSANAVEAMEKYGILERGMELTDVAGYAAGIGFNKPEQMVVLRATTAELAGRLDATFIRTHSPEGGHLFRLTKGTRLAQVMTHSPLSRQSPIGRALRRVKSALRVGSR